MNNHSLKLKLSRLDTYEVIEATMENLLPLAQEKQIRIHLEVVEDIQKIYGDPHGVQRVLNNIISNVIRYTLQGGEVAVLTKNRGPKILIQVEDTDFGIPPKDVNRILERFYRVEKGRNRQMGGTGLDPSIAEELVETMGSSIQLSSVFG